MVDYSYSSVVMATSLGTVEMVDSEITATSSSSDATASASVKSQNKKPTCIIVLGMAGSGKTTFVQVIQYRSLTRSLMCLHVGNDY